MSNLADADDALHSALYLVQLIALAGQALHSDERGPIMRGAEVAREEIEKAIDLIERADLERMEREAGGRTDG